jgi:PAS domain S-box-containing protein
MMESPDEMTTREPDPTAARGRRTDDRRADDRQVDDRHVDDRHVDDRHVDDRHVDDRRADARRETDRRVSDIVERMSDAFLAIGPDWRVTYANREVARLNGIPASALVGRNHWEAWPMTVGSEVERQYRRVMAEHTPVQFEHYYEGYDVWHDIRAYPTDDGGLAVFYRDITTQKKLEAERERQARELEVAMTAAEAANRAKSQFLANTSHEIRTPLNAVMGYGELLSLEMAGPLTSQQKHYVARIQATSRHLLGLVNDLLDLARIEAGQMRAAREPGLVAPVVQGALHLVEPQARTRRVVLTNACGRGVRAYSGDPERVRQILVNLMSNAVRFTEPGGRVTITCGAAVKPSHNAQVTASHATGWTFVRVEDTGIGIAPEQMDRIWGAFEQGDASRTRKFGGSGLGLTISRHLARLMGGDITVKSQPGLGSSFVLWLPAADPRDVRESVRTTPSEPSSAVEPADTLDVLAESPAAAEESAGLTEVAEALISETERVLATYGARLRADPALAHARPLAETELEDHLATFVVDAAQCVASIGRDGPDAVAMLRDGSVIQRLIAARHGAQRARLGWEEREVRREYEVLREEIHAAVRRARPSVAQAERALEVLDHMLARAEEESVGAYLRSREQGD